MGKVLRFISTFVIALFGALLNTFIPFGTYIINGLKKVFGFDYAGRESGLFDIAAGVFRNVTDWLFGAISTATGNDYLGVWNQFIDRIRPWDVIFPLHEIFVLLSLVMGYFLIKYAVMICMWIVRRVADIIP